MLKKKTLLFGLLMILCGFNLCAAIFDSILDLSSELYKSDVKDTKTCEKLQKKISGINSPEDCEKLNEKDADGFTAFQYIAMTPGTDDIFSIALDKYNEYMPYQVYNILNNPMSNIYFSGKEYNVEDYVYIKDLTYTKYNKRTPYKVLDNLNNSVNNINLLEKEYRNHIYTADVTYINFNVFLYVLYNEGMSPKIKLLLNDGRFNTILEYNTEGKIETSDQSFRIRPLTCAIRKGNKNLVEALLNNNVEVNYTTERSYIDFDGTPAHMNELTPLIEAIIAPSSNIYIVNGLLEKNADINMGYTFTSSHEHYEHYTPLFVAIDKNDYNLFETIYKLYPDPASEKVTFLGTNWTSEYSPLHWAIYRESINEAIIERLFDVATSQQILKKENGNTYTAAELLLARDDISPALRERVKNVDGEIKIFDAIENTDYEKLHAVLEGGMSANVFKNNHSAFEYAVGKAKDRSGDEASIKIIEELLNHGAKVNAIYNGGKTIFVSLIIEALDKGLDDTTRKLIRLFKKYNLNMEIPVQGNLPVLHYVVNSIGKKVDKELLYFLLDEDFKLNINQRVPGGQYNNWTPLLFAIINGNPDVAQFLIDKGANVNIFIKQDESNLFTPLALALKEGQDKCADILLHKGASQTETVSLLGADKVSMLMLACASSDWSMVSRLLDNPELKINDFDSQGKNAFMYAAKYNKDPVKAIKILRNLRGRKAVITHEDINGFNAYTLGFNNNQDGDVLLWLLEHGVPFQKEVSDIEMYVDNVEYYNVLKEICDIK